jgi:hypothetical protein
MRRGGIERDAGAFEKRATSLNAASTSAWRESAANPRRVFLYTGACARRSA